MNPQTDLPLFRPKRDWHWLLLPIAKSLGDGDFDIDGAADAEPEAAATESDLTALEQFNRELQRAIHAEFGSQPF